jgi:protein-S-isoprenylcysteine O-methyltransferase Ste14
MSLETRVAIRITFTLAATLAVLFLPAGTWRYWQGWAFLPAFFLPGLLIFVYFLRYDQALLERRMRTRETVTEQRSLMRVFGLLFLAAFLVPGFDHRLGWSRRLVGGVPVWVTAVSLALVAGGFLFVFWVLKVNSYAGRTIRVDEGQTVISTGPYAWVRHPMYLGSAVLSTAAPLALGSWVALPLFALLVPLFALRLLNEEKVLRAQLPGYADYCLKTRYHLIPFLW